MTEMANEDGAWLREKYSCCWLLTNNSRQGQVAVAWQNLHYFLPSHWLHGHSDLFTMNILWGGYDVIVKKGWSPLKFSNSALNHKTFSHPLCLSPFPPAATATKGLRRFGQSIKRVVREVKEQDNSGKLEQAFSPEMIGWMSYPVYVVSFQIKLQTATT